ncbi:MAG TPA: hypothetical protein PKM97_07605 [Bacteroidia bacterium]|nr:hypothetical protein [Bacteroidia bacterium]
MNKYYLSLVFILTFGQCSTETKTIRYKSYDRDANKTAVYTLQIPKGYKLFTWTGDHVRQQEYWYSDSSVIYLTNNLGSNAINESNIRQQEGAYAKRFQAFLSNDTITLSGVDSIGKYWKEVKLQKICLGYAGVENEKLEIFERALTLIQ